MTAKDYPVTFPYGATTAPYSVKNPHKGEDRKMPRGTHIVVNGKLVGYAGTTGHSTGVHTHTQKVMNGQVAHPHGGGFDVPLPTVVVAAGYSESIGNYVRYLDGAGATWSIFHMDQPALVKVGERLETSKEESMNRQDVTDIYQIIVGRDPVASEYAWVGQPSRLLINALRGAANQERATAAARVKDLEAKLAQAGGVPTVLKPGKYQVN